jgi:hypothetical protein
VLQEHDHCYARVSDPKRAAASTGATQPLEGPVYIVSVVGAKMYRVNAIAHQRADRVAEDTELYQVIDVEAERAQELRGSCPSRERRRVLARSRASAIPRLSEWRNFLMVVEKHGPPAETPGRNDHFVDINKMVEIGSQTSRLPKQGSVLGPTKRKR